MLRRSFCVALAVLLLSGLILPAESIAGTDPAEKISALLGYQLALKQEFLAHPVFSVAQALTASAGTHWTPGRQRLFVYLDRAPDPRILQQIRAQGVTPYLETWLPPTNVHPMGVMLADAPTDNVKALASLEEVTRLETAEQVCWPSNDEAAKSAEVKFVQDQGFTGKGIRIAVLDAGLDLLHPDIPVPVAVKDYSDFPRLDDIVLNDHSGHGTHVTATLLGRGMLSGGKYRGMAPGADLIFLKIGQDEDGAAASVDAIYAAILAAVDVYGAEIINLSYGFWDAYHDGTSALAQAVDSAAARGVLVFCSAGNGAADGQHASISLGSQSSAHVAGFHVSGAGSVQFSLVWNDGKLHHERYSLGLLNSAMDWVAPLTGKQDQESALGTESVLVTTPPLPEGDYFIRIASDGASVVGRRLHLYTQSEMMAFTPGDPHYTLDTPADASGAIAVAAYVSRTSWTNFAGGQFGFSPSPGPRDSVAGYSSRGPRLDESAEHPKPDLAAPGTAIVSARDRANAMGTGQDWLIVDNDGVNNGKGPADYYVMGGTSMACPVAAGAAALLLEAYPVLRYRSDKPDIIRNALRDGAITHRIPLQEGAGFLNLKNTFNLLWPYRQPSATPLPTWTPTPTLTATRTATRTGTRTPSPTPTGVDSATPTASRTSTPSPTASPSASPEPSPTATVDTSPTPTPGESPQPATPTPIVTASPTVISTPGESPPPPTATSTVMPTETATSTPTIGPTETPTIAHRRAAFLPLISRGKEYTAPSATPSMTPVPTDTPGASADFFDDFSDAGSGWPETDHPGYELGYADGEYRVAVHSYDWKVPSFAPFNANLTRCRINVSARQVSGDAAAYGIVFVSDLVRAFLVSPLGFVAVWRYNPVTASWHVVSDWQVSSAVATGGGVNALAVEVMYDSAAFYVNGVKLPVAVPMPEGGQIVRRFGVIGVSYSPVPVELRFDDFEVRSLDEYGRVR